MKVAGLQKTTLIDFPGKIASTIFTQGCNFHCGYCHNPQLIDPESVNSYLELDYLLEFLHKRKGLIDGVVITGGEPTLQPDLVTFLAEIKALNLKVKLDTNGSNSTMLQQLIEDGMVDYLAVDIKAPPAKYNLFSSGKIVINNLLDSIKLIRKSGLDHEFRTTVVPGIHQEEDIKKIAELLAGVEKYYLQNFRPLVTYNPEYQKKIPFSEKKLAKFKLLAERFISKVEIRNS